MHGFKDTMIFGAGLAGLSAGYVLSQAGRKVRLYEADSTVGGMSRTVVHGEFRFDLGGHRFITKDPKLAEFVKALMGEEMLSVPRKSKIYMNRRFFDYPLKPANAVFGLGIPTTLRIISDYTAEKLSGLMGKKPAVSLEDWVVGNFGRTMFDIYFKQYSEKVWGIDCSRISAEWVAQRIKGLSLGKAVKNAFFKFSGKGLATLADRFDYPGLGIGRISERLRDGITLKNEVVTGTGLTRLLHSGFEAKAAQLRNGSGTFTVEGGEFISTIPLTTLVRILDPKPPEEVFQAASSLKYRDILIATVMIDRAEVTDQTWIYIPEKKIPFGRIHEPRNWSPRMAPEGKTHIVAEFFCFEGDSIWNTPDGQLIDLTALHLEKLGFIGRQEVIGGCVVRVPKAYPLFEVGYKKHYEVIESYLGKFTNLHTIGRGGMFRYYNMDHTMESGIAMAEKILLNSKDGKK